MDSNSITQLLETLNSTNLEDVKQNLRSFKYQNHEVPHVREWINKKEQELRLSAQNPATKKSENKTKTQSNWHNKPLGKIVIIVIGGLLVLILAWVINYYLNINLKP